MSKDDLYPGERCWLTPALNASRILYSGFSVKQRSGIPDRCRPINKNAIWTLGSGAYVASPPLEGGWSGNVLTEEPAYLRWKNTPSGKIGARSMSNAFTANDLQNRYAGDPEIESDTPPLQILEIESHLDRNLQFIAPVHLRPTG
jgi:hypothetical protein